MDKKMNMKKGNSWQCIKTKTFRLKKYSFFIVLIIIVIISIILCNIPFEKWINDIVTPSVQKEYKVTYSLTETTSGRDIPIPIEQESPSVKISIFSNAMKYVLVSILTMILGCVLFKYFCKKNNYRSDAKKVIFVISAIAVLMGIFTFFTKVNTKSKYILDKSKFKSAERYVEVDPMPIVSSYPITTKDNSITKNVVRNIDTVNYYMEIATLLLGTWLVPLNYYQKKHENIH
ncbi:MAG: hypothetical protein Q4P30_01235 [Eubacteriales bacterium]|nr:hypothetical protein [Eubacteriales bacterium]